MNRTVLVILADGCEELEAVTVIDLLRRAGVEVVVAGLTGSAVLASRRVKLVPDCSLDDALRREYDMVALPGGTVGAENLANDTRVIDLVKKMAQAGKFTCAVCAAPKVLAKAGVLAGKQATAYPGILEATDVPGLKYTAQAVVQDGTVITSRGPGTAMDFALALIEALVGKGKRQEVEKALVREPAQAVSIFA